MVFKHRIGNLFYNPGGPGLQASRLHNLSSLIHPEIRERFDIIGLDLRGTGLSQPVNCSYDLHNSYANLPLYLTDETSFNGLVDLNKAFRQSCLDGSGPIIDYMDTLSIVKDHEAVRKALGDEKLTWLGQSYGTQLGSQYAELYPDNIRAMVLDGPYTLSQSVTSIFVEGASATDAALRYFFDWCQSQNATTRPAAHQNRTMEEVWTKLLSRAESTPFPCQSPYCGDITEITATDVRLAVLGWLFEPATNYPFIGDAIYEAAFNNNYTLIPPVVIAEGTDLYTSSSSVANIIIGAADWSGKAKSSPEDMLRKQILASGEAPLMSGLSASFVYFLRRSLG